MADEELAIASPALETPASEDSHEVETQDTELDTEEVETEDTGEDTEADENEGEDELDELEFAFKKYQVPKSLKEAVESLRADATRKTQDASAQRKALETREAEIEERSKATEAELEARAELHGIKARIAEYAKLTPQDWAAHRANDPVSTDNAWTEYQLLKDKRQELEQSVTKAETERTEKSQQDLAKRIQETLEHAKNNTSGLKPETIPQIVEFAQQMGVPEEAIKRNWSPIFADLLHFARIGKMAAEKQKTAPKPLKAAEAPKPVVPVAPRGAPPKTGLSDNLSQEEWMRRREAQVRKRA